MEKLNAFLDAGAIVAVFVDPERREVRVLRLDCDVEVLRDGDAIFVPELFPGWKLAVSELWPLEGP